MLAEEGKDVQVKCPLCKQSTTTSVGEYNNSCHYCGLPFVWNHVGYVIDSDKYELVWIEER